MPKKQPSFEDLYQELEATVQKLEAGNMTLDESLGLYQRGMQLARQCGELLDRAELRITELAPAVRELTQPYVFEDESEEEGE